MKSLILGLVALMSLVLVTSADATGFGFIAASRARQQARQHNRAQVIVVQQNQHHHQNRNAVILRVEDNHYNRNNVILRVQNGNNHYHNGNANIRVIRVR